MPGLVPGIHVLTAKKGVDGRDKPGHDDLMNGSSGSAAGYHSGLKFIATPLMQ
jgi:hypothetical protein